MDPTQFTDPDDEPDERIEEISQAEAAAWDDAFDALPEGEIPSDISEIDQRTAAIESLDVAGSETVEEPGDSMASETFPDTLPLLDEAGNVPPDVGSLDRSLRRWESMAADFPDDPHFARRLTDKPRNELMMIERGIRVPVVFLDRATMRPVLYQPENDPTSPLHVPPPPEFDEREIDDSGGRLQAPLVVTMARAPQHFRDAFEAQAGKWIELMKSISDDGIQEYQSIQASWDRAIWGN